MTYISSNMFLYSFLILVYLLHNGNAHFVEMVTLAEKVYANDNMAASDAQSALEQASDIVAAAVADNYTFLHDTLIELSGMVENVISKMEASPPRENEMTRVVQDMIILNENTVIAIQYLTCSHDQTYACLYSESQAKLFVNETETKLLRSAKIVVSPELNTTKKIELYEGNTTLLCIRSLEKDVAGMINQYSSIIQVPFIGKNNSAFVNQEVYLYVLTYKENLYKFVKNQYAVNSGTAKTFVEDSSGNYLELFGGTDEIVMEVNFKEQLNNPSFWNNITSSGNNDYIKTNISVPSILDIALLDIRIKSAQKCTIRLVPAGKNNTANDAIAAVVTRGHSTRNELQKPPNLQFTFKRQIFRFMFIPASDPGDWTYEDSDVHMECNSCLTNADVLIMLEYVHTSSEDLFTKAVDFVQMFGTIVLRNFTNNEMAFVVYNKLSYDEQFGFLQFSSLNTTYMNSLFNMSDIVSGTVPDESSDTVDYVNNYFNTKARTDSQKVSIIISQGTEFDTCAGNYTNCTMFPTLTSKLESGSASGIQFIAVELGDVTAEGKTVLSVIADDPKSFHYLGGSRRITDTNEEETKELAVYLYERFCFGYHKERVFNEERFGVVTAQVLNDTSNEWQRSEEIKMKSFKGSRIAFKSNFLGTFGTNVFVIVPELIHFDEIFVNFSEKLGDTPHVLAVTVSLLVLMIIMMVVLHWFDVQDNIMWTYLPMKYNTKYPVKTYYISFHTGFWSSRKLTATPYIILKGPFGETKARPVVDGKRENFKRWTVANFIMTIDDDIGDLQEIKIWHDCHGNSPKWYLEKILISEEGTRYVFLCGQWLSANAGDGRTYRRLFPAAQEMKDGRVLFNSVARFKFFDDYLLLSLFSRPAFSRFTRVQRLLCIMSMLYLSMLCNAMWFNTQEGTNSYGIQIGPLKITYKEFFVGLASSVITFPPALLMTFIFRKRKFKPCKSIHQTFLIDVDIDEPIFPWWFIFIAYGIAILVIACGATFTFFYSLQWGETVTVEWLTAFVLGTSQGIIVLEPAKVVLVSTCLACIFKGSAQKEVKNMAPRDYIFNAEQNHENLEEGDIMDSIWPGDDDSLSALSRAKRRAILDRKLYHVLYSIFIQSLYITLVAIICGHMAVTKSYHQNRFLKATLSPTKKINNSRDMFDWLMDKYAQRAYPKRFPNTDVRFIVDRDFMEDDIHYRIGMTRFRQQRVKGNCKVIDDMDSLVDRCYPSLSSDTQDTTDYCPGWKEYKTYCKDGGFTYTDDDEGFLFPFRGFIGTYDNKGYTKTLDPSVTDVRNTIFKLNTQDWIDPRTRLVAIESTIFNMNSQLFSFVAMYFEFPTQGSVFTTTRVETARLYPYIDSFDYFVLGLQILFLFITLYRFLYIYFDLWNMKSKCLRSMDAWLRILSVATSSLAIVFYAIRIERTMFTVEAVFNERDKFVTFELVNNLDYIYKCFIASELFIAILSLLRPLTINYYLYLMRTSIIISASDLASFAFFLSICMTAFAMFFYITQGSSSVDFRDIPTSYISLFRALLSLVKFKETFGSDISSVFGQISVAFFIFTMVIIVVNFFIAILNDAFAAVNAITEENKNGGDLFFKDIPEFDRSLNKHLWRKIKATLALFEGMIKRKQHIDTYLPDNNNVYANALKLDSLIYRICDKVVVTDKSDYDFSDACLRLCEDTTRTNTRACDNELDT